MKRPLLCFAKMVVTVQNLIEDAAGNWDHARCADDAVGRIDVKRLWGGRTPRPACL